MFCPDNLLNDRTQGKLLPYIHETEKYLQELIHKYDTSKVKIGEEMVDLSGAHIYPSLDLGFPNNVTRLAGGFATGMFVSWKCGTPIVPIDATVNVCSSSVFALPNFDLGMTDNEFVDKIEEMICAASKAGYSFSFDSGNHFIMIAQDKENNLYLILHSSAKQFKDSYMGLYPVKNNWYYDRIRTYPSPRTSGRYIRYIKGEDASYFIMLAHKLEQENVLIHKWFSNYLKAKELPSTIMEKPTHHHYYMPTDSSIAIGTFVESPGTTVPIFSEPGKEICLFRIGKNNWTVTLNGEKKCLVPHGWGQAIEDLRSVMVDENELLIERQFGYGSECDTYLIDSADRSIRIESGKKIRSFEDTNHFLEKSGQKTVNGTIKKVLKPVYLYCASKKGKITN